MSPQPIYDPSPRKSVTFQANTEKPGSHLPYPHTELLALVYTSSGFRIINLELPRGNNFIKQSPSLREVLLDFV